MPSLPLTLAARLLPVAVLATAGWAMTSRPAADSGSEPAGAPNPARSAAVAPAIAKPPAPCPAIPAETVKELVPGAKTAGAELDTADPKRRTGCSWHALEGFDYRWLDVTFETTPADQAARSAYADRKQPTAAPGLGDEASVGTKLTKEDGQQTREAVVVVRKANALVTVTYNGSDFDSKKAPGADAMSKGALAAAKNALAALDD
ncbi:hypothetical protein [Streptomyces sp. 8N616]|uniref:hypothetical protein n=1 Tax=Streptomyces sp. 8N616 TaxID=3457414 RepID=UPI003FD0D603